MKANKLIQFIAVSMLILASCKEEPPTPPPTPPSENTTLSFKVNSRYNGFETQWNDWQITNAGDTIKFDKIKYILSNFKLEKQDGSIVPIAKSYAFISLKDNIKTFSFADIPKGDYKSISFMVGLDSTVNHGDPQQYAAIHPLNPSVNDMYWSWSGGYIFNVVEGNYKNKGANAGFSFHVATIKNNRMYKLNYAINITKNSTLGLDINMDKYLSNIINYSLKTDGAFSHSTPGDLAMTKFLNNSVNLITISSFE